MASASLSELWMQRALDLAALGTGRVSPNPMVGAVLIHEGKLLAEGFHAQFGGQHAERDAIGKVANRGWLAECTLYVTLEPCCHHGKTPPCTELIVESGIREVVVAMPDPNPLVSGMGIESLRRAGIRVHVGLLEQEATFLNRHFILNMKLKRPYYLAKWAVTADGFMGRTAGKQGSPKISAYLADVFVHRQRSEADAILIGAGTALADNPLLNNRLWTGKNPIRVILDMDNLCHPDLRMFMDGVPLMLFRTVQSSKLPSHVEQIMLHPHQSLYEQIDKQLLRRDIAFVLVEGGRLTLEWLNASGRMDEAYVIQNESMFWNEGIQGPVPLGTPYEMFTLGTDCIKHYMNPVFSA